MGRGIAVDELTIESLQRRIVALEESNQGLASGMRRAERRLRIGGLLALVLASAVTVLGFTQAAQQEVTARVFSLENRSGSLRQFDSGMPGVKITNPGRTSHEAEFAAIPSGEVSIAFFSESQGSARASMGILDDGSPFIRLRDPSGNIIWSAP
jgi:hypothetical protein